MGNMRKQNLDLRSKVQCYRRMVAKNQKDSVSDEAMSRMEEDFIEEDHENTMTGAVLDNQESDRKIIALELASP